MRRRDLDLKSQEPDKLLIEIRALIEEARRQTAASLQIAKAPKEANYYRRPTPE